jgi:heme A synthase
MENDTVSSSASAYNAGLYAYSVLLAACTLVLIMMGACVTSEIRALPGSTVVPPPTSTSALLDQAHYIAGIAVGVLTAGLAIWIWVADRRSWMRTLGGIALLAIVAESLLGSFPILHALLAPLLFALLSAIALFTSKDWARGAEPAEYGWQPSLRSIGVLLPVIVFMQIALGAAYRHNAMGVLWHIFNALLVLLLILVVGVFVIRQYPKHRSLRPAAHALVIIASTQVLLGFTVFLVLLISKGNNLTLVISSVAHVVTGSLTLAATVIMVIQIRRHMRDVALPEDSTSE